MDEISEKEKQTPEPENKRPVSLTLLCILTFIGSGLTLFSNMMFSVLYDLMPEYFKQMETMGMTVPGIEILQSIPRKYFIYDTFLSAMSLYGAIIMWKLKKTGFHFYTASQLIMIILSMVYMGISASSSTTFLTLTFIMLYGMNLKYMKN